MSNTKYNVGDIVKLKSGGPNMTVNSEVDDRMRTKVVVYACQWFAGKKLERGLFPPDSLQPVTEDIE